MKHHTARTAVSLLTILAGAFACSAQKAPTLAKGKNSEEQQNPLTNSGQFCALTSLIGSVKEVCGDNGRVRFNTRNEVPESFGGIHAPTISGCTDSEDTFGTEAEMFNQVDGFGTRGVQILQAAHEHFLNGNPSRHEEASMSAAVVIGPNGADNPSGHWILYTNLDRSGRGDSNASMRVICALPGEGNTVSDTRCWQSGGSIVLTHGNLSTMPSEAATPADLQSGQGGLLGVVAELAAQGCSWTSDI